VDPQQFPVAVDRWAALRTAARWEKKLADQLAALGVPVAAQFGASLDFVAGRVRRAPRWVQRAGLEWAYRISREPRRLTGRYARNALFQARMVAADLGAVVRRRLPAG
jgi:UDP-N-acetyl-D-mannosaminuronic acid transferase (WecB/TagA/CpsF family)